MNQSPKKSQRSGTMNTTKLKAGVPTKAAATNGKKVKNKSKKSPRRNDSEAIENQHLGLMSAEHQHALGLIHFVLSLTCYILRLT